MEESKRLITSWVRITHWLSENFPESLENLYSPAFDSQIEAAEATIGLRFPDALKTLLLEHNGEDHHWPPGIFPDGHRFLPTEDIVETWFKLQEFNDATPEHWLPFAASRSKAIRFLDFNPPQGGSVGQVVEVNFDQQTYEVLADSFVEYIEKYAMDLGVNKYAVIGDDILLHNDVLHTELLNKGASDNALLKREILNNEPIDEELVDEDIFEEELFDFDLLDSEGPDTRLLHNETHFETEVKDTFVHETSVIDTAFNDTAVCDADIEEETIVKNNVEIHAQNHVQTNVKRGRQNSTTIKSPKVQNVTGSNTEFDVPVLESAVKPINKEPAKRSVKVPVQPKVAAHPKAKAKPTTPAKPVSQQARKVVELNPAKAQEPVSKAAQDRFESGERLIIVGEMTTLMGKEEMLFTVESEHAKEYTFLAKASFTKGFSDIALDQYVRILAKKFHGEIKSHFIEQGLASQPEYVAFDYVVLPVEKPSTNKVSLPPPENLDQIAHSILQSIQNNFRRSTDYKEIKLEQNPNMRSKFYSDSTEKLLKLGFHYTADLVDQASVKSVSNTPPYFRVMSFFDDGVVASFYHIKPKFSWPFQAARKVIEFETELSDGNIIISTTAEDEIEYPLPKTINRYVHANSIPLEGLLHKHRSKIRRYQTRKPDAAIVKVRSKKEFVALRQRRQQMIYNHLKSIGWVTKEYVAKHFNNKEVAEQVYARIKQFAGTKV
ncbi:SMI1/KNR4 family protein [Kaarinaea lacus]